MPDLKPYVGKNEDLPSRMTSIQEAADDEDTTSPAAATTPEIIQGPMTRARACEQNYVILLMNYGPEDGNK
uniref:Uncharacterized protein n=1 Tax=Arundo donax TaxID=35708 RepID=A0A0A9BTL3_ARUDO